MPPTEHQFDIRKIIRWFVREEVKTPLSFFFKVIPYMTAAWIAILYAPIPVEMKFALVKFSAWVFMGLSFFVGLFALVKPKHLVYGETGHRAEHKLEFGTEKKIYTSEELSQLEPSQNPQQLISGEGHVE